MINTTENFGQTVDRQHETGVRRRLEEKVSLLQEFNDLLIESSGDCIMVVDGDGLVLSMNKTGRESLKCSTENGGLGRHWVELFEGLDTKVSFTELKIPRGRSTFQATSRPGGRVKFWNITFTAFNRDAESDPRFIVVARDVTEHMLVERALRQSEEAFRKLFEENPIGIV